ncbi:lipoyl protein ligase domain-containing protein [Lapidilactobacillus luobeiensis]|uniref:lipoyl protein ligase domain-containing protein n=1 Tax=Lapidilactobacillus luobeiensis TaxID=2950371 RepID=UPI0021C43C33|nr:lipoate--protein ligase family protein [Lapidilactobacillus luobeiensis]
MSSIIFENPTPVIDVLQRHYPPNQMLNAFADTQAFLRLVQRTQRPLLHYWTLDQTVILGLRDRQLLQLSAGLKSLDQAGWHYFFRNAGGLGIPSDQGILNISLILPANYPVTIDQGYQLMTDLLQAGFDSKNIQLTPGEVATSYCPGTFDLSVGTQKVAGIAQRRSRGATAIMAYLSVNGDQTQRGELMRSFYQRSEGHPPRFPAVDPQVMTTLADFIPELQVHEAIQMTQQGINKQGTELDRLSFADLIAGSEYQNYFSQSLQSLIELNQPI